MLGIDNCNNINKFSILSHYSTYDVVNHLGQWDRFGRFGWQFGFDQTEDLLGLVRFFSIREPTKPNLTGHQPGMKVYHSNKLGSVCTELPNQLPNKNSVR